MSDRTLLISCYESGFHPTGVTIPAGVLRDAGLAVDMIDLAVEPLDEARLRTYRFVGISAPMHTALRLAVRVGARVRELNPGAHICFYGTYAELCRDSLATVADSILGSEFEADFAMHVMNVLAGASSTDYSQPARPHPRGRGAKRLRPSRNGLVMSDRYVRFVKGDRVARAGAVATTRGCKHECTHCPIAAVYRSSFYAIDLDTVMADIDDLVSRGITHVSFSDPDFLNGPTHALRVTRKMHSRYPDLSFDCTVKVEHLLKHRVAVMEMRDLGCAFVVSAVESLNDEVLNRLCKGHTAEDVAEVVDMFDTIGLTLRPTLVPFTPWETRASYMRLLEFIGERNLMSSVDPIQLTVRLLVPPGSLLLQDSSLPGFLDGDDGEGLAWGWRHPDPAMDSLQRDLTAMLEAAYESALPPEMVYNKIVDLATDRLQVRSPDRSRWAPGVNAVPRLTEPWFC